MSDFIDFCGKGVLNGESMRIKQAWRSGESTHIPAMCPRFNSQTWRHMWVEFVVSRPLFRVNGCQNLPPRFL